MGRPVVGPPRDVAPPTGELRPNKPSKSGPTTPILRGRVVEPTAVDVGKVMARPGPYGGARVISSVALIGRA